MTNSRALTDDALIAILRKEEEAASANWTGALSKGYECEPRGQRVDRMEMHLIINT